ncbi:hypothetical protein ACFWAP_03810 [Streptomyces goshikiensis]|uniref:hypothetical protein n=1 Tax=Streptomyces goshikiensis TaxID=1942 RepID=UPI003661241B
MMEAEPEEVRRLDEAIRALASIEDDEACAKAVSLVLSKWPDHHEELRKIRQERVSRLRERSLTWGAIGALLKDKFGKGVTGARAQQIATGLSGAQRKKNEAKRKKDAEG